MTKELSAKFKCTNTHSEVRNSFRSPRTSSAVDSTQSDATVRKRVQRLRSKLPSTPVASVSTVHHLIKTSTPRRRKMLNKLQKPECSDVNTVEKTLDLNKVGRPQKTISQVKKKLAFSKANRQGIAARNLRRYICRKLAQEKRVKANPQHELKASLNLPQLTSTQPKPTQHNPT